MLLHESRLWLRYTHATLMDALIAHLALQVSTSVVRILFTFLARSAQKTMPDKAFDEVSVQVHALSVDHDIALGAL